MITGFCFKQNTYVIKFRSIICKPIASLNNMKSFCILALLILFLTIYSFGKTLNAQTVIDTIDIGSTHDVFPLGELRINDVTNRIYMHKFDKSNEIASLLVIDGLTNDIITDIPVNGPELFAFSFPLIEINPNTNRIYVSSLWSYSVEVIDGFTNEVIADITVSDESSGEFFGSIFVSDQIMKIESNPDTNLIYVYVDILNDDGTVESDKIVVIDGATNKVVDNIQLLIENEQGQTVHAFSSSEFVINTTTNRIYVPAFIHLAAVPDNRAIMVIDGNTNQIIDTIPVGFDMGIIGVNPVTNMIYVPDCSGGNVCIIDGSINKVISTIAIGDCPESIGIDPTNNRIYVSNSENVSVIDGLTNEVIAEVDIWSPTVPKVNTTTNHVYLVRGSSNHVSVIDGSNDEFFTTSFVVKFPGGVEINPITNRVYVDGNLENQQPRKMIVIQDDAELAPTIPEAVLNPGDILIAVDGAGANSINPFTGERSFITTQNSSRPQVGNTSGDIHSGIVILPDGNILTSMFFDGFIFRTDPTLAIWKLVPYEHMGGDLVGMALEPDGNIIIVTDGPFPKVVRINPVDGKQTTVTSGDAGIGAFGTEDITVDRNGNIFIGAPTAIIRVNPITGEQSFVSSGGKFKAIRGIATESNGDILVCDCGVARDQNLSSSAVIRVNPITGEQTVVSSGGLLGCPVDIAIEADGNIVVSTGDWLNLVRIDPVTGLQSLILPPFLPIRKIAIVPGNVISPEQTTTTTTTTTSTTTTTMSVTTPKPPNGKSFTFNCEHKLKIGSIIGLEKLTLELGESENCALKLINHEREKIVEVSSLLRRGLRSAIKVEPTRGVTDANGELKITITAIRKGKDWISWGISNENGGFEFSKKAYDAGKAWGMFVEVR